MNKGCKTKHFAEGGVVRPETADELMARMSAKYGVSSAASAPPPVQQAPQTVQQHAPQRPQGIIGLLRNRGAQIDEAVAPTANLGVRYANGGKIKGPGTPTSDSIPAEVAETKEPIRVATDERIVSAAQDKVLESVAKKLGYDSLDQMLEVETGKPVGPTIKGGERAAADGMSPEEREYRLKTGNIAGPDFRGLASAATSFLPDESPLKQWANSNPAPANKPTPAAAPESVAKPDANTFQPAPQDQAFAVPQKTGIAAMAGDQNKDAQFMTGKASFDENGKQTGMATPDSSGNGFFQDNRAYTVQPTKQEGISKVVSKGVSPLFTNIKPEDAVSGLNNQTVGGDAGAVNEGLARYARANAITQSMIDKQPMGGVSVLGDGGVEADNAEKTQRWREDDLIAKAARNPAAGQLANTLAQGNSHIAAEGLRSSTAARGQDVNAISDANRNQVAMRGQDIHADSDRQRLAGNPLDQQAKQIEIDRAKRISDLQEKAIAGDAGALKSLNDLNGKNQDKYVALHAAGGSDPSDPTGMKKLPDQVVVVNERTGQRVNQAVSQQSPQAEYQAAIQRAGSDKAKIEQINKIARANGVIQ